MRQKLVIASTIISLALVISYCVNKYNTLINSNSKLVDQIGILNSEIDNQVQYIDEEHNYIRSIEQSNAELIQNISLIPVIPAMKALIDENSTNLSQQLALERAQLPLGSPFEHTNFIVTSYFGDRVLNHATQYHQGLDIIPKSRSITERILATSSGTIIDANENRLYGKYILIDHGKYLTFYAHLSKIYWQNVTTHAVIGEHVDAGDPLGIIGTTGLSTGVHLHYEVRIKDTNLRINPLPLVSINKEN